MNKVYKVYGKIAGIGFSDPAVFERWEQVEKFMYFQRFNATSFIVTDKSGKIIEEVKSEDLAYED
ncbi:hypothetical protein NYE37_13710 [Thermoactinomyces sp. FSL K6-2592]|uniref:hypothetical protein n=1 Tax=Thermoactinomyces sp. FSL K6-2592 TaxID=2975347 RepID=UPI0030FB3E02